MALSAVFSAAPYSYVARSSNTSAPPTRTNTHSAVNIAKALTNSLSFTASPFQPFQPFSLSAFQHFSISAFQHFSISAFQPFSISAFQHFSISAFQLFSFSAFQHFP